MPVTGGTRGALRQVVPRRLLGRAASSAALPNNGLKLNAVSPYCNILKLKFIALPGTWVLSLNSQRWGSQNFACTSAGNWSQAGSLGWQKAARWRRPGWHLPLIPEPPQGLLWVTSEWFPGQVRCWAWLFLMFTPVFNSAALQVPKEFKYWIQSSTTMFSFVGRTTSVPGM